MGTETQGVPAGGEKATAFGWEASGHQRRHRRDLQRWNAATNHAVRDAAAHVAVRRRTLGLLGLGPGESVSWPIPPEGPPTKFATLMQIAGYATEEWDHEKVYGKGSIVLFAEITYISLAQTTGESPSTHPLVWRVVGGGSGGGGGALQGREVHLGSVSGAVTLDVSEGTTFFCELIGETVFTIVNAVKERGDIEIVVTQDNTGGHKFTVENLAWIESEPPFVITAKSTVIVQIITFREAEVIIGVGALEGKEGKKGEKGEKGVQGVQGPGGEEPLVWHNLTMLGEAEAYGSPYDLPGYALSANGQMYFRGVFKINATITEGTAYAIFPEGFRPTKKRIVKFGDANELDKVLSFIIETNGHLQYPTDLSNSHIPYMEDSNVAI